MAKKQMCDIKPATGISRGQSTEHLRNYKVIDPDAKKYGYYDPTRMKLNFEVGRGGIITSLKKQYSLDQRLKDNLRRRGIKLPPPIYKADGPKERRVIANIMLGGNRERMRELAFGDQQVDYKKGADNRGIERKKDIERWAVGLYKFIAKKYGEDNIIAFVVHLDEKNPHVHCTVVPVNEKNKISYNQIFGGNKEQARLKFNQLHDEVAEFNRKWGLERGDSVMETGAKHRTSEEYWDWLSQQCTELEKKKDDLEKGNKLQSQNDFLNRELNKANIRYRGLSRMVENLTRRKETIEEEISSLREEVKKMQNTSDGILLKRERLEEELDDIEKKLKDKLEKLRIAEEKLDMIALKRVELENGNDELQRAINRKMPVLTDMVLRDVKNELYDIVGEQMATRREKVENYGNSLYGDIRIKFDNLMEDLAGTTKEAESFIKFPNEVAAIAGALFLGYIDQAISFAQAHGGGGGGPGSGWGRDKDDDDDRWLRKCCFMATRLMRPGPKLARKGPRR